MKTRYAILFTITAIVIAVPATAVPPKPINAAAVTLLPADGTPEALRKAVAVFSKNVAKANSDAEAKRAQLDRQMEEGLDKAITKAQSSGDINTVLALKTAKDQFATLTTSDVPLVKNALEFREKKTVEIETARVADAMKAAKELNDELEKTKRDETIKGNFDSAKTIADHQEKIFAWVQTIRLSTPQQTAAETSPIQSNPNLQQDPVNTTRPPVSPTLGGATKKTISVDAAKKGGARIGHVSEGSTIRVRYLSGKWTCDVNSVPKSNPDADDWGPWGGLQTILTGGSSSQFAAGVPKGTASDPFEFVTDESSNYSLRMKDDGVWDNAGVVRYEVEIIPPGTR